ncbi:HPP family protein [Fusarium heterosporum]|uniref:HPP family protein n=1 Tax=Fusarium heterosporum TaxID=42747 RepID=A0A8H5WIV7_FUSHE|nr:HPP family protein [Fusarium heterosporum]
MSISKPTTWNFDIDQFINPFVPSPPWQHIPYPVAYIFGYRRDKPRSLGTFVPVFWAFIGIFIALSVIELASERIPSFVERGAPIIVASFGAGAVLEFYAIESPLAQPRNFFGGQIIAAIIGVSIGKLFLLSNNFLSIQWLGGAIACATVTAIMALTKTIHPPAGATALIAVVDDRILGLGWFFIAVVAFNCTVMFGVALLVNNVQRAFPVYWWTPVDLKSLRAERQMEKPVDIENKGERFDSRTDDGSDTERHERHDGKEIILKPGGGLVLPNNLFLMQEEIQLLEEIANRL